MFKSISKILVAPLLVFLFHLIFCFIIPLYKWYPLIDNFIHFLGGVSIFIASLVAISILTNKSRTFSGYTSDKIQKGLLISKYTEKKKNTFSKQTVLLKTNPEKVRDKQKIPILPLWLILILSFALTVTVGVFWEFFEFSCDYFLKTTMQLSSTDTMSDLFFDNLGALMIVCIYYLKTKKSFSKND